MFEPRSKVALLPSPKRVFALAAFGCTDPAAPRRQAPISRWFTLECVKHHNQLFRPADTMAVR